MNICFLLIYTKSVRIQLENWDAQAWPGLAQLGKFQLELITSNSREVPVISASIQNQLSFAIKLQFLKIACNNIKKRYPSLEIRQSRIQYAGSVVHWDKWLVDQASNIPSIIFSIVSYRLRALNTLFFYFGKFLKKYKNELKRFLQKIIMGSTICLRNAQRRRVSTETRPNVLCMLNQTALLSIFMNILLKSWDTETWYVSFESFWHDQFLHYDVRICQENV